MMRAWGRRELAAWTGLGVTSVGLVVWGLQNVLAQRTDAADVYEQITRANQLRTSLVQTAGRLCREQLADSAEGCVLETDVPYPTIRLRVVPFVEMTDDGTGTSRPVAMQYQLDRMNDDDRPDSVRVTVYDSLVDPTQSVIDFSSADGGMDIQVIQGSLAAYGVSGSGARELQTSLNLANSYLTHLHSTALR